MEEGTLDNPENRRTSNPPPPFSPSELEGVARYLDTDPDFWVFRRFRKLHLVNVLRMELDLVRLEHKLDKQLSGGEENEEEDDSRTLLPDIQSSLSEYDAALTSLARFKSYREPDRNIVSELKEWGTTCIENANPLLHGLEIPYPGNTCLKDLASIAAVEKSWTHQFIDKHHCLRRIFEIPEDQMPPEQRPSSKNRTLLLYSEESVQRAEAVFLHLSFCILLICPIIGLSYMQSKMWKLVLLGVFLFVASLLFVGLVNMPNKSGLALVAGYAAILVVFLSGNGGP
ncbi:hypothetical protein F5882DRAFT_477699 [Hyaloscypha sp. PMI_1271]|nr:hypothetical protein F5882DRAFT_477699 [Hyaloscypha sp. PMI_1271]